MFYKRGARAGMGGGLGEIFDKVSLRKIRNFGQI